MSSGRRGTPNKNPRSGAKPAPAVGLATGLFVTEAEQRALDERGRRRDRYMFGSLTIDPRPLPGPRADPLLLGIPDADYECKHGNLPMDRVIDCDCWGGGRVLPMPARAEHDESGDPGEEPGEEEAA